MTLFFFGAIVFLTTILLLTVSVINNYLYYL